MTDLRVATRPPASTVRSLSCAGCGGTIALRAAGSTVSIVCEHCGSTLDATKPPLQLIAQAHLAMLKPLIPLGTRGTLDGTAWEVVGYQQRNDGHVWWSEYLLFNPYEGYAFLSDDQRRFSLGRLLTVMPDAAWNGLSLDGRGFKRFGDTYRVRTSFVVGEFYWRVRVGDEAQETDYVRPGTMLACEETGNERTWTRTVLQDWGVAERAFGIEPRVADYRGQPAPHEPSPYRTAMRDALLVAALALAACIVIAIGTLRSTRALERQVAVRLDGAAQTSVLGPITVTGAREKVLIRGRAGDLDNQWVELDYSLVNKATQERYDAGAVAERYRGRDADGAWSEGNPEPSTALAAIPRGTYDLVVEASAKTWNDPTAPAYWAELAKPAEQLAADAARAAPIRTVPVTITVDRGGGFAGPFWLALLAIGIWPLIAWARHRGFEQRRQSAAASGPDDSEEDDES